MANRSSRVNGTAQTPTSPLDGPGIITYTPWGQMSANMVDADPMVRPTNISWPPKETDSDSDWVMVGRHAMASAGPFRLAESPPPTPRAGQVLHGPIAVASVPSLVGTTFARNYSLHTRAGDGTYLRIHVLSAAQSSEIEIWWKKI